jgi:hypothetical protein
MHLAKATLQTTDNDNMNVQVTYVHSGSVCADRFDATAVSCCMTP